MPAVAWATADGIQPTATTIRADWRVGALALFEPDAIKSRSIGDFDGFSETDAAGLDDRGVETEALIGLANNGSKDRRIAW